MLKKFGGHPVMSKRINLEGEILKIANITFSKKLKRTMMIFLLFIFIHYLHIFMYEIYFCIIYHAYT